MFVLTSHIPFRSIWAIFPSRTVEEYLSHIHLWHSWGVFETYSPLANLGVSEPYSPLAQLRSIWAIFTSGKGILKVVNWGVFEPYSPLVNFEVFEPYSTMEELRSIWAMFTSGILEEYLSHIHLWQRHFKSCISEIEEYLSHIHLWHSCQEFDLY